MKKLHIDIPAYINEIITQLQNAGFEAYIVGGCVRDAILKKTPDDWDVCTSADPGCVKDVLKDFKVYDTGILHGTVTAVKNGDICEITTFRSDGSYTDHRRPDSVSFSNDIKEDLARRDFTVNAMAYAPNTGLIDIFSGQEDLSLETLRCVGNAETRFTEDALRIIRALRFSACLGFQIATETKNAIFSCCELTDFVARERIYNEMKRLLCGKNASKIICEFASVFERIFSFEGISKNSSLIESAPKDVAIRLALLFWENDISVIRSTLENLKADKKTINNVVFLLENSGFDLNVSPVNIRKLLSEFGKERSFALAEFIFIIRNYLKPERDAIIELIDATPVITLSELAINGSDIISMGVAPGKEIKSLLNNALNAVICDECKNEKSKLLSYISNQIC